MEGKTWLNKKYKRKIIKYYLIKIRCGYVLRSNCMLNENYDPSKANFDGNNYRITVTVILINS
jgi:hypothetical protein